MPKKSSSALQTGPLSVGDVINGGIRIYRDHFKSYFMLALTGYLWLLVPVYGWAKFSATLGILGRLAFGEVSEHPETVGDVRSEVNPRMWNFLGAGIVTGLILTGVYLGGAIAIGILVAAASNISGQNYLIIVPVVLIAVIAFLIFYLRVISQLFVVELPLAIEKDVNVTSAISRSWELTKGSVARILLIVFVGGLASIPVTIVVPFIFGFLVGSILTAFLDPTSGIFLIVSNLLTLPVSLGSGALMIPFWQAIKAIIYYDLRSRKEGLGLQIRDSKS